ncbi:MAG: hypothetical protein RXQ68_00840 [Candidatus Nanopusillus sp.]
MYGYYIVTTLDNLIESVKIKMNNPNYDSLYQKKLEDFLKNNIKKKYENIPVLATVFLIEKYNKKGSNIFEEYHWNYKNKEFASLFEKILRLTTKSKRYYLISIEYYNRYPILIAGEPDGLSFEGNMNNKAKIFEVKSFNLTGFIQYVKELKDYVLIKKVLDKIKINSSQLMLYQYLLERTQKFGLIGEIDKINLYGKIYFYSEYIEYLRWARKIIEQNFNIIKRYAIKYNAYNLSLKDEETININNKNIYYFEIDLRIKYNKKTVENYLKNLNELIKYLK